MNGYRHNTVNVYSFALNISRTVQFCQLDWVALQYTSVSRSRSLSLYSHDEAWLWGHCAVVFLAVSGPKFTKFFEWCRGPFVVLMPFFDCFYRVSRRRSWPSKLPLSREGIENRQFLDPKFCCGQYLKRLFVVFNCRPMTSCVKVL